MANGGLVSNDIMLEVMKNHLGSPSTAMRERGWILDGYPRTLKQADDLTNLLQQLRQPLDKIFFIKVSENDLWNRIKDRWIHAPSGRVYNTVYSPPKIAGLDDITGEPLTKRSDDNLESIRARLKIFNDNTLPILEYFESRGLLVTIESPTSDIGYRELKQQVQALTT